MEGRWKKKRLEAITASSLIAKANNVLLSLTCKLGLYVVVVGNDLLVFIYILFYLYKYIYPSVTACHSGGDRLRCTTATGRRQRHVLPTEARNSYVEYAVAIGGVGRGWNCQRQWIHTYFLKIFCPF